MSDDSFGISFRDDVGSDGGVVNTPAADLPFTAYVIDSSNNDSKGVLAKSNSFSVEFASSSCDRESDNHSTNCQNSPHSVIDISNTNSQSNPSTRDQRSNSSPLPLNDSKKSSKHRKTPSCDFMTSHATRPGDLALKSAQCQTNEMLNAKLYLYIQMQLCKRESLKDWLAANKANRDRLLLLDIFHQIVSAMDYVHGMGLMHRDLKVTTGHAHQLYT
jgi:translation initiation factor 2-alpha kinase 3